MTERAMRAKMQIRKIELLDGGMETLHLVAVGKPGGYPLTAPTKTTRMQNSPRRAR